MQIDAPKAADHNGCQQIIRQNRAMRAGLKILCASEPVVGEHGFEKAHYCQTESGGHVGCGPGPGKSGPILMFPAYSHVDSRLVPTIYVRGRPLGPDRDRDDIHLKGEASRFRWLRALATSKGPGVSRRTRRSATPARVGAAIPVDSGQDSEPDTPEILTRFPP
jgi:hypothetical protein